MKPTVYSFDFYPFYASGEDDGRFFANLATVGAHAVATKTPFWQFVQSISYANRRATTKAEKLWMATQTIAYGGAGISYFTYRTPPASPESFGSAIIDRNGNRTTQYEEVKANNVRLQAFGRYLVPATWTAVFHNGPLAVGTAPRTPGMPVYLPNAAPITVGLFSTGDDVYAFLANRDYRAVTESDVVLAPAAAPSEELDVASGRFVAMGALGADAKGTKVRVKLDPGDGTLLHLRGPVQPGAPGAEAFVGTVRSNGPGMLDVVDATFGAAHVKAAGWNECPAGYAVSGRLFDPNGFWLCVRADLAARTFYVGNVVENTGSLYAVTGGTATLQGAAGWNDCPSASTFLGRRFDGSGYWVCMK